jgi:uncharacterized protein (TIGR02246 family)
MSEDERAIREVIAAWMSASEAGDVDAVLNLMADDVVFLVPGREPFGKKEFAAAARTMSGARLKARNEIRELSVQDGWAYLRSYIEVEMVPPGGSLVRRAGYTLTILRKEADGRWRIARDANLLTATG